MIKRVYPTLAEQQLDILENFDLIKVHKVMKALQWTWFNSKTEDKVPSLGELFLQLQGLLKTACNELEAVVNETPEKSDQQYTIGTGGFVITANYWADSDSFTIDVGFEVASWSTRD